MRPQREMVRVVRTPNEGVQVDRRGKRPGRGAYLCNNRACWEKALAGDRLDRALRTTLTREERAALAAEAASLPELETSLVAETSEVEPALG